MMTAGMASAASVYNFAQQSILATGKWVKISIPETGVYEITYDELMAMGFSNPAQVRIYGQGGYPISEVLNGSSIDDLQQVPVLRTGNKLCFYGNGPIRFSLSGTGASAHFIRTVNPYSQVGCYLLTEQAGGDDAVPTASPVTLDDYVNVPTTLSMFYHEKNLASIGLSGKEMLGEDFKESRLQVDYYLPKIADSTIVVHTTIGCNTTVVAFTNCAIYSGKACDTVPFNMSSSRIYAITPDNDNMYYSISTPYAPVRLTNPEEHGKFEPFVTFSSADYKLKLLKLDYATITYKRDNVINEDENGQIDLNYTSVTGNERFQLPKAPASMVVWNVTDAYHPEMINLSGYNDSTGRGRYFAYPHTSSQCHFVAFDPAVTLKKISSFEEVPNQNLHAMPTPDLLIITDKVYHEQAERVAQLHRDMDGIDVAVVDQDQVFNEFSSGTRDAMAYRLLCKMLFDRDPSKLKNLLLFGIGLVDNRESIGKHEGTLLTYQSDISHYKNYTYTSDDFFGFLKDDSGSNLANDKLDIGVGRITCADVDQARNDVDKLVEYYANPDYGVWRNNALSISDSPDKGLYLLHGEYYKNLIIDQLNTGMHVSTIHNSQYPRVTDDPDVGLSKQLALYGKQLWSQYHKSGMYFTTYVGHAGSIGFTKYSNMWDAVDVMRTSYKHIPIMSTACCNVARFDSGSEGIAELMFHKRDGGAIALLTSCRNVFASNNDMLNAYFIQSLFNYGTTGKMTTLGEAYRDAKLMFNRSDINKLMFFLLGDPAIKVNYPIPLFKITKVNNTDMTDTTAMAQIGPLVKFGIEAQVMDEQGAIDEQFNGDATVSLYDKEDYFTTVTAEASGGNVTMDIYFNRPKLAEVSGRVVNGIFHGEMVVPKAPLANNETVLLRVYAHKDNSTLMVNGLTKQITMLPHDDETAIQDEVSPVVEAMYINDAEFTNGSVVPDNSLLYIHASDNEAIDVQSNSINHLMTLVLDGGKPSYADITSYVTADTSGRAINVEYPLNDLPDGVHSLTFTVYDLVGNCTSHTINFVVGNASSATMTVDKLPATVGSQVSFDMASDMETSPEFTVRVTDAVGHLVWMTKTSSFPVAWDMKDMNGNSVPAGLYRYYGTYSDGVNYGGTPIGDLIVIDPLKVAAR